MSDVGYLALICIGGTFGILLSCVIIKGTCSLIGTSSRNNIYEDVEKKSKIRNPLYERDVVPLAIIV